MPDADRALPCITVLAGTNGGGKSSIAGAMLRSAGGDYFNPDEAARRIRERDPSLSIPQANGLAWHEGKRLLERAIDERKSFAFETTLGGATMTELLEGAAAAGLEVRVWYVALQSPELHLARVRARVARGGHDIPEADVRRRYTSEPRQPRAGSFRSSRSFGCSTTAFRATLRLEGLHGRSSCSTSSAVASPTRCPRGFHARPNGQSRSWPQR